MYVGHTAMVFAAGFGERMRPITDRIPKPMVTVKEKPLIDYTLDSLAEAGIKKVVVNTHYKADILQAHLASRTVPEVIISYEEEILETGGGVCHAKAHFETGKGLLTLNSDVLVPGAADSIKVLLAQFDPQKMDGLLLLQPTDNAFGYHGKGDFSLSETGELTQEETSTRPYVFTGIQVINPELCYQQSESKFSLGKLYRDAKNAACTLQRFYGVVHEGDWLHIGTPEDLEAVRVDTRGRPLITF